MHALQELNELLKPQWGAEKWILEGWELLTTDEKQTITTRVEALFKDGLPFELKFDKLLYVYSFSLLAQLEVLAIQIPIKLQNKLTQHPLLQQKMHQQLLDEVFHGIVFTKIVYLLSSPLAFPPEYNQSTEKLCDFVREEECPIVAVVLLNLICEGWIEEFFKYMQQNDVAPNVFQTILDDETRHVEEADLYCALGIPDKNIMLGKVRRLEDLLFSAVFTQHKYMFSTAALTNNNTHQFLFALQKKHARQLEKVGLTPGGRWRCLMQMFQQELHFMTDTPLKNEMEFSPMRSVMFNALGSPQDSVMVGEFDLNISELEYFKNTTRGKLLLSPLILQTISCVVAKYDRLREYFYHGKIYRHDKAKVSCVIKFPECHDHLGLVMFEHCHETTVQEILYKIKMARDIQVYCYHKRQEIEKLFPNFKHKFASDCLRFMPPVVGLSNIGASAYTRAKTPLFPNENLRFMMLKPTRKPIWNECSHQFEAQDVLPMSLSADHRLLDGNIPAPELLTEAFQINIDRYLSAEKTSTVSLREVYQKRLKQTLDAIDMMMVTDMKMAYTLTLAIQSIWYDCWQSSDIFPNMTQHLQQYYDEMCVFSD